MVTPFDSQLWNDGLKLISFCPVCETRSRAMVARPLAQQGETHLFHIRCRKCQNAILALVLLNQTGASSVGILTDLSYEDVVRSTSRSQVSIDDVIDVHRWCEQARWEPMFDTTSGRRFQRHLHARVQRREQKNERQDATHSSRTA